MSSDTNMQTFLLFGKCFFDFGGDPPLGSFDAYLASINSHPQDVYSGAFTILFSAYVDVKSFWIQPMIGLIIFLAAASSGYTVFRTHIQLKAKGLKINSNTENGLIPWDWLKTVEIRYRGWNIFPNYVCFDFRNRLGALILMEDILQDMDITTLLECVRTWAPNAGIKGDVWLAKSESIASYTELWLKDLSQHDKRLRLEQTHEEGALLNGEYRIVRTLSSGGQGTAYLATTMAAELINLPPEVVLKEFILPENDRGSRKVKDSLLREASLLRRIDHPFITRFFDCFIEDLRGYLVIEYSPGLTLKDLVLKKGLLINDNINCRLATVC